MLERDNGVRNVIVIRFAKHLGTVALIFTRGKTH